MTRKAFLATKLFLISKKGSCSRKVFLNQDKVFYKGEEEKISLPERFSCFEKNSLIFSWFLKSRTYFSINFEAFAV